MLPTSRAFVALWAANTIVCVAAGYALASRTTARTHSTPCSASRAARPVAPVAPAAPAATAEMPPLLEGPSPWTEPAPSQPNARRHGTLERPTTGDPIPPASTDAHAALRGARWLGRAPHVPLTA
jgi:hypothetical protein